MKKETRRQSNPSNDPTDTDAFRSAIRLLTRRDHTEKELFYKLIQRGLKSDTIDSALKRCRDLGYLDDAKTAIMMAEHMASRGNGPLKIRRTLGQKGVDEAFIEKALTRCGNEDDQVESAITTLKRIRFRLNRETDPQKRRTKAYRFLTGRGFSSEVIKRATLDI